MNWLDSMLNDYYKWLRDKTTIEAGNADWYCIGTPFVGAFNDFIEVYALKTKDIITLSDNGQTLNNLELQGVNIQNSTKRRTLFKNILLSYGLKQNHKELLIEANEHNFPQKKHNFLNAILEINNLAILARPSINSIFKEDVRAYLDELDIIYTSDFISRGATGLDFTFDFQIAKRDHEIILKSFGSLNKNTLSTFLFSWMMSNLCERELAKKKSAP